MFIGAGIESENYDVVLELIASTIKELQTTLTEVELMSTKEAMVASIRSISDFPNSFINFFYTEILEKPLDYTFSLDEMIESFLAVDLKSVMKVYENLTLDTVYFITGGEK
jgi:predicted Zn-dependent peptidase